MRPLITDTPAPLSSTPRILLSPADQKLVDSARDILMHQRDLSEEQAYSLLLEMAEKRKTGVADISLQLVNITKRLTI